MRARVTLPELTESPIIDFECVPENSDVLVDPGTESDIDMPHEERYAAVTNVNTVTVYIFKV